MARVIHFYYDLLSPYAYLCYRRLTGLRRRSGAAILLNPVSLPRLLEATGNPAPLGVPAKAAYLRRDTQRLADYYGVQFNWPSVHPQRTGRAMSVLMLLEDADRYELTGELFDAIWCKGLDLGDNETLQQLVGQERFEAAAAPEVREQLQNNTDELVALGGFGVPSMAVKGELFFGNDRLFLVERALNA